MFYSLYCRHIKPAIVAGFIIYTIFQLITSAFPDHPQDLHTLLLKDRILLSEL